MDKAICILASDSPTSRALIAALAQEFHIAAVIVERHTPARSWKMLRYRLKRLGLPTVLGQLALVAYDRFVIRRRSREAIKSILAPFGQIPSGIPWHEVDSINNPAVVELLRRHQPAACVVTGTSIIRKHVLATAPVFLNIHCGITPAYRGVHGAFWAVVQRDLAHAGVTVHRVDAGVDTGGVVEQATIVVAPRRDTFRTLVAKQYAAGIPLMAAAVRAALDGTLLDHERTDLPSRQWFAPTLLDYVRFCRAMRSLPELSALAD